MSRGESLADSASSSDTGGTGGAASMMRLQPAALRCSFCHLRHGGSPASRGGPGAVSSCQFPHLRLRLLQPELHVHLAVHRGRRGQVLLSLLLSIGSPGELAEAEMAMGDERAHTEFSGAAHSFSVVICRGLCLKWFALPGDLAQHIVVERLET